MNQALLATWMTFSISPATRAGTVTNTVMLAALPNKNVLIGGAFAWAFIIVLAVLYFVPSAIALLRRHRNAIAIVALNIFLGWTLVGWVVSLVWGLSNPASTPAAPHQPQ